MDGEDVSLVSRYLDSFSAGSILASLVVSAVGYVAFTYGRRQKRGPQFVTGLLLMFFPYFVTNVFAMSAVAALLVGLMTMAIRAGY